MLDKIMQWSIAQFIIKVIKILTSGTVSTKMKVSNIELIKESEGLVLKAYKPTPNDVWTIGYGHTKGVQPGQIITKDTAERYLREDLAWVEKVIDAAVTVPLNQNEYDALASLVFNIGESQFRGSSVLRWLNSGNREQAADSFVLWNKQRNKTTGKLEVLNGLTKRRQKEKELFLK